MEQRRHARAQIDAPLTFRAKGSGDWLDGVGKDISIGGMFVETASPPPFGTSIEVSVQLPGDDELFTLPGVVRWVRPDGMGVQFGLLGARETYVIIEIGRKHGIR